MSTATTVTPTRAFRPSPALSAKMAAALQQARSNKTGAIPSKTHAATVDALVRRGYVRFQRPYIGLSPLYGTPLTLNGYYPTQAGYEALEDYESHPLR